ncbi:MAG: 2OG-Fe(II) oxygenase [Rhizobacter sp.]
MDTSATHQTGSPLPASAGVCVVIPGFLSAAECQRHIAQSEARGFASAGSDYPPTYRNNDRQVTDDPALAQLMLARLAPHVPPTLRRSDGAWSLHSVNERFRYCRYRAGQRFNIHQDGVHHRSEGWQSCLTFMVYLTDGDAFEGGDTVFYSAGPAGEASSQAARVIGRVRPRAGSLIVFDHSLWHAGETVTAGVKHILRSDVLYRREATAASAGAPPAFQPGHQGYVWTLARIDATLLASGGRDTAIHLWTPDGQALGELRGHRQSVLGLAVLQRGQLASVSRDRSLRLWDAAARRCVRTVTAHDAAVLTVTAWPDGTLATGGADALVKLWRSDGEPLATLAGHQGWVWAVAAVVNGRVASASEDGSVKLWSLADGRCLHTLPGATPLRDLVASADGKQVITGGADGSLAMWQWTDAAWRIAHRMRAHTAAVRRLRWLDDATLASAGEDNQVRIWRLADFSLQAQSRHDNFVTDVLPVSGGYLSCSYDGCITHNARPAAGTS